MSDPEKVLGWLAVLLFVVGGFSAFLRARDWYLRRGMPRAEVVVETPAPDVEEWPQTRFSLRRGK